MTTNEFRGKILARGGVLHAPEGYNTNNAWGFGGAVGTRTWFVVDGVTCFLDNVEVCYRHLASHREVHVHVESPANKPFTLDTFLRILESGARTHVQFVKMFEEKRA